MSSSIKDAVKNLDKILKGRKYDDYVEEVKRCEKIVVKKNKYIEDLENEIKDYSNIINKLRDLHFPKEINEIDKLSIELNETIKDKQIKIEQLQNENIELDKQINMLFAIYH